MKKQKIKERGITLIALVITIIVLLILAGVTLNIVINTGLLSNTENATYLYEEKAIQEALSLEITNYEINTMNETTKDYFGYLQKEGIITEQSGGETEEDEKGKKAEVITKKLINTTTKRKYYLYANGELYVEILKSDVEKYIGTLWDGNGVIEEVPEEGTVAYLIKNDEIKIGDYVPYNMSEEKTHTIWEGEGKSEHTLQSENLKWRVLSINSTQKEVTLISERPTNIGFYIPEEKSDAQAILEINKACEALYGDGINECRNLNVKDISLDNFEMFNMVSGDVDGNFYYDNLTKQGNCNYYTMLIVNDSKLSCYNFNEHNEIKDQRTDDCYSDVIGYLPIRPVITLSGETYIEVEENNVTITTTKDEEGIESVTEGKKIRKGQSLEITAEVEDGYEFSSWEVVEGTTNMSSINEPTITIIPTTDVVIKAKAIETNVALDNTNGNANRTLIEGKPTYQNPVIPVGFRTVNTEDAKWKVKGNEVEGWNNGLVIEDSEGNQFVWVPVNNTTVTYTKWDGNITDVYVKDTKDDEIPSNVTEWYSDTVNLENKIDPEYGQIKKYGGFYIARYEAGIPEYMEDAINPSDMGYEGYKNARNVNGKPVSKKNQIPWNYIDYTNSQMNAESMYNENEFVQSGLVTGRMWDTTLTWFIDSGAVTKKEVEEDSRSWGNYKHVLVKNVTSYSTNFYRGNGNRETKYPMNKSDLWYEDYGDSLGMVLDTGNTEYTRRNNIYDLAGNLWEWTNEIYTSSSPVIRVGNFALGISNVPAAYRAENYVSNVAYDGSFRVGLYIR